MKLHMHPVSMTSRPVRLMVRQHGLDVDEVVVDLFTGAHLQPPFSDLNPSKMVPVLQDGGFVLTESSAILKYLADRFGLDEVYPRDLQARARVNERMDWFNTNFYRDYGYGLCYPQVFPHHKRPDDALQRGTLEWARDRVNGWLAILDRDLLGDSPYVCGDALTIADYFGASLVTLGEVLRLDFADTPRVAAWIERMKQLDHWDEVNAALYGFRDSVADQVFVGL